jgi:membrane glycosyltransferase
LVGGVVACFGIGGLIYAALVKLFLRGLGQAGLAVIGGIVLAAAYLELALGSLWWLAPIAIGLGFYMLHNTLHVACLNSKLNKRLTCYLLPNNSTRRTYGERPPGHWYR